MRVQLVPLGARNPTAYARSFPRSQLDSGIEKLDFFVENFLFVMTMTFMTTDL